jgi:ribosomal protein S20
LKQELAIVVLLLLVLLSISLHILIALKSLCLRKLSNTKQRTKMKSLIKKIKEWVNTNVCIHDWYLYRVWEDAGYEYKGDTVMVERLYKICDKCGKKVRV